MRGRRAAHEHKWLYEKCVQIFGHKSSRGHLGDVGINGRIIVKYIAVNGRSEFIRISTRPFLELSWTLRWNFGLFKSGKLLDQLMTHTLLNKKIRQWVFIITIVVIFWLRFLLHYIFLMQVGLNLISQYCEIFNILTARNDSYRSRVLSRWYIYTIFNDLSLHKSRRPYIPRL
jgi:hypothetical protein